MALRLTLCKVKSLAVKTTIMIDEELWRRFRESVVRKYESSRKLSENVEEAVKSFDAEGTLSQLLVSLGHEPEGYPSSSEVISNRPKVAMSASRTIKEMRRGRAEGISGLKRNSKKVS